MKWWAQSFLVGVPKITCGFRNDDGVVKVLQTFKTAEIPHETQVIIYYYYYDNTIAGNIWWESNCHCKIWQPGMESL